MRLVELERLDEVEPLARRVHSDPAGLRATGWRPEHREQALPGLVDMWRGRFERGWSLSEVRHEDEAVGLAGLGPLAEDADEPPWLAVYLLRRGEGLGEAASRELLDRAERAGATQVQAVTHGDNEAAQGLLTKLGFQHHGPCQADWAVDSDEPWEIYRVQL